MKYTPKPYQAEGVTSLLRTAETQDGFLLADEPGVGKTGQACLLSNALAPMSVLVLCPASLLKNWQKEFALWDIWGVEPEIITAKTKSLPRDAVVSYDTSYRVGALRGAKFDLVIADESHYLKNPKSKRAKFARQLCDNAQNVLLISGTPMENCPVELFWQMVCLRWMKPSHYLEYAKRHCGYRQRTIYLKGRRPRKVVDVSGAARIPELRQFLQSRGMVRRLKADVLKDLPPKTSQIIELPRKTEWRSSLLQTAIGGGPSKNQVKYLKSLVEASRATGEKQHLQDSIAEIRRLDGEAKVPQAVEYIESLLNGGVDKLVVFAYHKGVIEKLESLLSKYSVVTLHGGTRDRQTPVDAFQCDTKIRVFIGQIKAAGVGITLTAASHVVFVELDWVPGLMSQAADRLHRSGQKKNVTIHYLVYEDSVDATIAKSLVRKQNTLDQMDQMAGKDVCDELFQNMY